VVTERVSSEGVVEGVTLSDVTVTVTSERLVVLLAVASETEIVRLLDLDGVGGGVTVDDIVSDSTEWEPETVSDRDRLAESVLDSVPLTVIEKEDVIESESVRDFVCEALTDSDGVSRVRVPVAEAESEEEPERVFEMLDDCDGVGGGVSVDDKVTLGVPDSVQLELTVSVPETLAEAVALSELVPEPVGDPTVIVPELESETENEPEAVMDSDTVLDEVPENVAELDGDGVGGGVSVDDSVSLAVVERVGVDVIENDADSLPVLDSERELVPVVDHETVLERDRLPDILLLPDKVNDNVLEKVADIVIVEDAVSVGDALIEGVGGGVSVADTVKLPLVLMLEVTVGDQDLVFVTVPLLDTESEMVDVLVNG
jgi:hypothetical protein